MNVRRWMVVGVVLTLQLFMGGLSSAMAGPATESIRGTVDEVLKILSDKELKAPARHEDRRQRLEKAVAARFDYSEMSRRSLGAQWNQLSDKEKQEFVDLFRTLLTNTYADKVETYSGEGVQYLNERTEKEYAEVRTKVLSGKTEIPMDYRLLNWRNWLASMYMARSTSRIGSCFGGRECSNRAGGARRSPLTGEVLE